MESPKKTYGNDESIRKKQSGKRISNKRELEIVWEQVFPEDAELRIERAFEMLLKDDKSPH